MSFGRLVWMVTGTTVLIWGFAVTALANDRPEGIIFPPMFEQIGTAVLTNQPAETLPTPSPSIAPDFAGFGWGVGFEFKDSIARDIVSDPGDVSITTAQTLQVTKLNNVSGGFVLESHITFQAWDSVAVGPYFSISPSEENLVDGVGMGILFELNRPQMNLETRQLESSPVSFNIGVGITVLFDQFVIRPGLKDGFFVPDAVMNNTIIQKEQWALQFITVAGF